MSNTKSAAITTARIQQWHDAAAQAGDLLGCAICQIAIYGEVSERTAAALPFRESAIACMFNRDQARQKVAQWVSDAEAQS